MNANYKSLLPRLDLYTSDKGVSQKLVMLEGTIPISYRGAKYNIPVQVVVMAYHPSGPPTMYVKPTATMEVKQRHDHVDRNGLVYLPYLANWDIARSTLIGAVAAMTDVFSRAPPVYASSRPSATAQPQEERARMVALLADRARARLREVSEEATNDVATLLQRRDDATEPVADATDARRASDVQRNIAALIAERDQLEAYMENNRVREGDIDVDTMIHPRDLHSEQVLECLSKDAALMDALDQLQDAVVARRIDLDTFSRETSRLAREQFYARALLRKVKLQQAHMQQSKRQPA